MVDAVYSTVHTTDDYLRWASSHCARTSATVNDDLARPQDLARPKLAVSLHFLKVIIEVVPLANHSYRGMAILQYDRRHPLGQPSRIVIIPQRAMRIVVTLYTNHQDPCQICDKWTVCGIASRAKPLQESTGFL